MGRMRPYRKVPYKWQRFQAPGVPTQKTSDFLRAVIKESSWAIRSETLDGVFAALVNHFDSRLLTNLFKIRSQNIHKFRNFEFRTRMVEHTRDSFCEFSFEGDFKVLEQAVFTHMMFSTIKRLSFFLTK
jgi:hypothetical protein